MKTKKTYKFKGNSANEITEKALINLKWDFSKTSSGFKVDFGMNHFTWGSIMNINTVSSSQIEIKVETKWPVQIIDWGDSKNKINEFINELKTLENN